MTSRTLPDDFPGLTALQEAGEATPAKIRKRVADDTLTEIPGIGEATAEKIKERMASLDEEAKEPAVDSDADIDAKEAAMTDANAKGPETNSPTSGETLLNTEGTSDAALLAGDTEAKKSGAEKNEELANHDLADLTPAEKIQAGIAKTGGERLRDCGAVFVDDPTGPYASKTAVRIPPERGRIKVLPISHVSPIRGMLVKDGDDVYNVQEPIAPDANPDAWLQVRSPNTGKPFVD